MARLNAAWETVGDPDRRAAYDRTHVAGVILDPPSRSASPARSTQAPPASSARSGGAAPTARAAGSTGATWRRGPNGEGGAGPPPGNPSGTVLGFGRHIGWSLGEIARVDPGYLEWLDKQPQGQRLRDEIDRTLRARGLRLDTRSAGAITRAPRRFGLSRR